MKLQEQLVETYLTHIEGCAVLPQLQVHRLPTGQAWSATIDFLAIDLAGQSLQIVEVSSSRKLEKAAQLARSLGGAHRERLERCIRESVLHGVLSDWVLRWRFFVRAGLADVLRCEDQFAAYRDARGAEAEIVTLEHVFNTLRDRLDRLGA